VNGVINVITKSAKDTQGAYAMGGGGTHEKDMEAARVGGRIGKDLYYRVYGKHFERGANYDPTGQIDDSWRQGRFGFRADWEPGCDDQNVVTITGDHYVGNTDCGIVPTDPTAGMRTTGESLLMRWRHACGEDSNWSLQAFYDNTVFSNSALTQGDKTLDVEFQYRFPLGDRHSLTCGAGFRSVDSLISGGDQFGPFVPTPHFITNYTNQFIQDEITLIEDRLFFTLGCKLEQNPYTGLEYQPTARLLYASDRKHAAWGAISRAVRTPARAEEQATFTIGPIVPDVYFRDYPNDNLSSEAMFAYEIGYREQTTENLSWDVTAFYNVYEQLITPQMGIPFVEFVPPPPHLIIPAPYGNAPGADTCGVELSGNYAVSRRWSVYCQYTFFHINVNNDPDGYYVGNDPCNQVYLRSSWDLRDDVHFDLMARYVDRLSAYDVSDYISMDLRLGWRPRKQLELAVVGQNLLQEYHWEYFTEGIVPATEVPRGVYGTLTWRR
ncbi:MAG: TonB-dependent receptor, partial [Pirellulales bacterium]|nr:TonB-dependent receptor [Pirellulales bacterium]